MSWLIFLGGVFVGCAIGVVLMALLAINGERF